MDYQPYGMQVSVRTTGMNGDQSEQQDVVVSEAVPPHTVLIAPVGAPLPDQLDRVTRHVGSMYERLAPLVADPTEIVITFFSGAELDALAKSWVLLVQAKNVRTLSALPGQMPDPLFTHAASAIGVREVSWMEVEGQLARQARTAQSAHDSNPASDADLDDALDEYDDAVAARSTHAVSGLRGAPDVDSARAKRRAQGRRDKSEVTRDDDATDDNARHEGGIPYGRA